MHAVRSKQSLFKCLVWPSYSTWDSLSHLLRVQLQLTLQPPSVVALVVEIGANSGLQFHPSVDKSPFLFCGTDIAAPFSDNFDGQWCLINSFQEGLILLLGHNSCRNVWKWIVMEDICHEALRAPHPTMLSGCSFTSKHSSSILCAFLNSFVDVFLFWGGSLGPFFIMLSSGGLSA